LARGGPAREVPFTGDRHHEHGECGYMPLNSDRARSLTPPTVNAARSGKWCCGVSDVYSQRVATVTGSWASFHSKQEEQRSTSCDTNRLMIIDDETLRAHFSAHRARWTTFHEQGSLLLIGPFADRRGALAVFTNHEAAEEFATKDPFVLHGLVARWTITPWHEALLDPLWERGP